MRRMATAAALGFHRCMFVDKRPLLVDMALRANRIPARDVLQLPYGSRSMRVMAVGALHQTLVHPVVKGFSKVRLGRGVASVTQLGLALHQEVLFLLGVMRGMAVEAPDVAAGVRRFGKMGLRMCFSVATETARTARLPRLPLEAEYLALVTAARHMFRTRTMAAFTTLLRGAAFFFIQSGLPMRRFLPAVVNFLVTGFAGLGAHVLRSVLDRSGRRFALIALVCSQCQQCSQRQPREHQDRGCDRQSGQEARTSFSKLRHVHSFPQIVFVTQRSQAEWIIRTEDENLCENRHIFLFYCRRSFIPGRRRRECRACD